tara:strand:+ start:2969 stop:3277 length:309 start_codon:yes stop_codon:yes gene_type:complete
MPRKKKIEEKIVGLDERFSLDSYEGILGSLRIVAEGVADESLKRDKADLLLKVLSSARMTITEKRKTSAISNNAASSDPIGGTVIPVNSSGPFAVYSSQDKQ